MIGVLAPASDHRAVSEFFELFKTPWEYFKSDRRYDVVLCVGEADFDRNYAKLVLHYAGHEVTSDADGNNRIQNLRQGRVLQFKGQRLPIFGQSITFRHGSDLLVDDESKQAASYQVHNPESTLIRLGYDLFVEVTKLLTVGQPSMYARTPTLDLHISLLRHLIISSSLPLCEIPPIPDGYRFIACLSHDVDHGEMKHHRWDHTALGFLYRATLGSLLEFSRGRLDFRRLIRNWIATLKLPLVYVGLASDYWANFADQYFEMDRGLPSTYFIIPFKGKVGRTLSSAAPSARATRYCAKDIAQSLAQIISAGSEVCVHGIDAWLDIREAREEFEEIRRITGVSSRGVRMHWLYFHGRSPEILEEAGAVFDSTVGYRDTVGYRAGTTQAYKPLTASRILELSLHVMDTSMFYPKYMNLTQKEAVVVLEGMVKNAVEFGGCTTINWHDRSLAPERNWDYSYSSLISVLKAEGAWFATMGQAAAWFQKRRSAAFDEQGKIVVASETSFEAGTLPSLQLRIYDATGSQSHRAK